MSEQYSIVLEAVGEGILHEEIVGQAAFMGDSFYCIALHCSEIQTRFHQQAHNPYAR